MAKLFDNKISTVAILMFYLFLQFQFTYLLNFPITVSLLGFPLFLFAFVNFRIPISTAFFCSVFMFITILNQLFSGDSENVIQFLRTFLLVLITVVSVGVSIFGKLKQQSAQRLEIVLKALPILAGISVAQTLLGYRFGTFVTNPFGKFSYYYQYDADLNSSITRASGLFSEPSFNALICLSFVPKVLSIKSKKRRNFYCLLLVVYMASTFSLTGIVSLGLILILWIWNHKKIGYLPTITLSLFLLFTINYIVDRLNTLYVSGSSANFRVIAPVKAILDILPRNLFGIPLGSLEKTISTFGFLNGSRVGSSVDNGFFLIILYFGLLGLVLIGVGVFQTLKVIKKMQEYNLPYWPIALTPIFALNFNGGIFLPDFICVMIFMIVTIRSELEKVKSFVKESG